jgi:hypothetical protein
VAATQLSDVIIPQVYLSYVTVNSPERTAFFQSGVAVKNDAISNAFANGGTAANIPFWKDLDATVEPNYTTDNPSDVAVPNKITAGDMVARKANMNQGYSNADLTSELSGQDPMQRIRDRFGMYWMRQWQRRAIATVTGLYASDVANNGGDMVVNIATEDGVNANSDNIFSQTSFVNAAFTLGDAVENISAIAVHSVIYQRMVIENNITFVKPSDGNVTFPTYMGKFIIIDDGMPVIAGTTSGYKYLSVLFGNGAIGYGENTPPVPAEVFRAPDKGNGGGVETLWERKSWIIHPFGYTFTGTTVTGQSPTLANLKLAANWARQVPRKNVPLAFLLTNG